jgi:hypothetical protein
MDERNTLAKLLRSLADCVENSTAEDVDGLLAGRGRLRIEPQEPRQGRAPKRKVPASGIRDWVEITARLRALPSREDGQRLIEGLGLRRAGLEQLARAMDLPVSTRDNAERLRQKIIESCIGSRLVSQAIRGH